MDRTWRIPNWIFISFFGSALSYIGIVFMEHMAHSWRFSNETSAVSFLLAVIPEEAVGLVVTVMVDVLVTMPVMAFFHFLPKLLQIARAPTA
jgi:membrane-bound metal-dependent hydrolase YbcI (DUF457 family)